MVFHAFTYIFIWIAFEIFFGFLFVCKSVICISTQRAFRLVHPMHPNSVIVFQLLSAFPNNVFVILTTEFGEDYCFYPNLILFEFVWFDDLFSEWLGCAFRNESCNSHSGFLPIFGFLSENYKNVKLIIHIFSFLFIWIYFYILWYINLSDII